MPIAPPAAAYGPVTTTPTAATGPAGHVSSRLTGHHSSKNVASNPAGSTPQSPKTPIPVIGKSKKGSQKKKGTKPAKNTKASSAAGPPRSTSMPNTPQSLKTPHSSLHHPASEPNTPPSSIGPHSSIQLPPPQPVTGQNIGSGQGSQGTDGHATHDHSVNGSNNAVPSAPSPSPAPAHTNAENVDNNTTPQEAGRNNKPSPKPSPPRASSSASAGGTPDRPAQQASLLVAASGPDHSSQTLHALHQIGSRIGERNKTQSATNSLLRDIVSHLSCLRQDGETQSLRLDAALQKSSRENADIFSNVISIAQSQNE